MGNIGETVLTFSKTWTIHTKGGQNWRGVANLEAQTVRGWSLIGTGEYIYVLFVYTSENTFRAPYHIKKNHQSLLIHKIFIFGPLKVFNDNTSLTSNGDVNQKYSKKALIWLFFLNKEFFSICNFSWYTKIEKMFCRLMANLDGYFEVFQPPFCIPAF